MRIRIAAFILLYLFWIVVTESLHWDSLFVGAFFSVLIVYLNRDILPKPREFPQLTYRRLWLLFLHLCRMVIEVVKANIVVARIVLHPRLPLNQGLVIFTPGLRYPLNEVILANSITLTPGTFTLDVDKDVYTVHLLDMAKAESLASWTVQDNLRHLEEEP